MPWIGPASRSCLDGLLAPFVPRTGLLLVAGLLLAADTVLAARDVCAAAAFFELAAFFTGFLVDFFLLPAPFFADGLAAAFLRDAGFADFVADFLLTLPADFLRPAFFTVDFFAAGFFRAAAFFVGAFFRDDFFVLNLRLFPEAFLPAAGLRDAAFFLPVPACFCFLLAAFFAGMFHSCRSEKNAELYIACWNLEPHFQRFSARLRGISQGVVSTECSLRPKAMRPVLRSAEHGGSGLKVRRRSFARTLCSSAGERSESCCVDVAPNSCLNAATIVLSAELLYTTRILLALGTRPPDAIKQDQTRRL
jgi:hypothetical protein